MRALLIKYFFLDYMYNIYGWRFNGVRAATFIVPVMTCNGLYTGLTDELSYVGLALLATVLFWGFVYPRLYPLKMNDWNLLDESQKFQYGSHQEDMTEAMFKEWLDIYTKLNAQ